MKETLEKLSPFLDLVRHALDIVVVDIPDPGVVGHHNVDLSIDLAVG